MKVEQAEVHRREIRAVIEWGELKAFAIAAVLRRSGVHDSDVERVLKRVTATVRSEDQMGGSVGLGFKIGTRLIVEIDDDLGSFKAAAEDAP